MTVVLVNTDPNQLPTDPNQLPTATPQAAQHELINLNPDGWTQGARWHMMYALDCAGGALGHDARALLAGDSEGKLHVLDPRAGSSGGGGSGSGGGGGASGSGAVVASVQIHRVKTRICSVAVQPHGAPRVLTGGNDHTMRMLDLRKLSNRFETAYAPTAFGSSGGGGGGGGGPEAAAAAAAAVSPGAREGAGRRRGGGGGRGAGRSGGGSGAGGRGGAKRGAGAGGAVAHPSQMAVVQHPSVVNSAWWSPITGRKIMTTCQVRN